MSLDLDRKVRESSRSDKSWTKLYERTRRDAASSDRSGSRGKRARSLEFVPGKRLNHGVLRTSFVSNKGAIKAYCSNQLAAVDGAQAIAGLESAFTAWVATQCERPLGHGAEARFLDEIPAAKKRELDARCKFQVFPPAL